MRLLRLSAWQAEFFIRFHRSTARMTGCRLVDRSSILRGTARFSGCSSISRAPASGAGGREGGTLHPHHSGAVDKTANVTGLSSRSLRVRAPSALPLCGSSSNDKTWDCGSRDKSLILFDPPKTVHERPDFGFTLYMAVSSLDNNVIRFCSMVG